MENHVFNKSQKLLDLTAKKLPDFIRDQKSPDFTDKKFLREQTRYLDPMLSYWWSIVWDAGTALKQQWVNVECFHMLEISNNHIL